MDEKQAEFQAEVGAWADKVMSQSTNESICKHLIKEAKELAVSYQAEEAADCYLILLHFAYKNGFDLLAAAKEKHEVCKRRKWGKPDADGVVEHIRSEADEKQAAELVRRFRPGCEVAYRDCKIDEQGLFNVLKNTGLLGVQVRLMDGAMAGKDGLEACDIIDSLIAQLAAARAENAKLREMVKREQEQKGGE